MIPSLPFVLSPSCAAALLFCCIVFSSTLAVALLRYYSEQRKDMLILKQALRSIARKERLSAGLHLTSEPALELWHSLQALISTRREKPSQQVTFQQVITLGQKIAAATGTPAQVAREVVELLAQHSGKEVCAVALYTRVTGTGMVTLDHLLGLPRERIGETLSIYFDRIMDAALGGENVWGYTFNQTALHNLKTFDIGMELHVPLSANNQLLGGIWLGFSKGSTVLSPERREFVQAIAEHAASSLTAAQMGQEKIEESKKEKDFLLGISHDLRAPGNIALFALRDLLNDQNFSASASQRGKLQVVEQSLNEQLEMLSDVLNYAKHKRGLLEPNKRTVQLTEVLGKILENYAEVAKQMGLAFYVDEVPELSLFVDHGHLQRIVSNYLSNAIKFTASGSITVSFHAEANNVEILVTDTGAGIAVEERGRIFAEFTRTEQSRDKDGVGLGLALAKALAELNGGYVMFLPNQPCGSIFGVGLPVAAERHSTVRTRPSLGSILVIDDDPATGRTIARYLRDTYPQIHTAQSCEEAYSLIEKYSPSLIVSDLWLQNESVESLLRRLQDEGRGLPVLLLTGCAQPQLPANLKFHELEILEKPSSREQVLNAVRRLMGSTATPLHLPPHSADLRPL